MKTLEKTYVSLIGLGILSASAMLACSGGASDGTDDEDQDGPDAGSGGSATGGRGGTAGKAGGGGATGGAPQAGSGGQGNTNTAGSGGSAGAAGGSAGGSAGQPPMMSPYSANLPDCVDNVTTETCLHRTPKCWFRPDWQNMQHCGPPGAVPLLASLDLKNDGFCGAKYTQDGIFGSSEGDDVTIPKGAMEPAAYTQALASNATFTDLAAPILRVYLPGGTAGYNAAANGKVAVSFWTGVLGSGSNSRFKIENVHEYLVKRNEIPYTIVVFLDNDVNGSVRVPQLRDVVIPALKARWSKISDDPNYRVIAGQSTAGANAFDTAWMGSDVVSRAIGGSPSLVCFTCLGRDVCPTAEPGCTITNTRYQKMIQFCPARAIRWSATVGTCDIYGTTGERVAAGCGAGAGGGSVDASGCGANWLKTNIDIAKEFQKKNMPVQLFVIDKGIHLDETWTATALPHQLRWIFKDITCAK